MTIKRSPEEELQIIKDYLSGIGLNVILNKWKMGQPGLKSLLYRHDILYTPVIHKRTQEEENEIIKDYLNGDNLIILHNKWRIDRRTLQLLLKRNNVIYISHKRNAEEEDGVIEDYLNGDKFETLCNKWKITRKGLKSLKLRHNIPFVSEKRDKDICGRKISWDINFFENESVRLAYWMGFMYADGNLSKNGTSYSLRISIVENDRNLLEQFSSDINLNINKIGIKILKNNGKPQVHIGIGHKKLGELLKKWGIVPNKTYNFVEPNILDELLPHFIRGWIDGDGSIDTKTNRITIVGNKLSLEWLIENIHRIGFYGKIYRTHWKPEHVWGCIQIQNKQNLKTLKQLLCFDNEPCLKRKWDKINF